MSLRQQLLAQLERFDDDAFAALANRGLLRRAYKDLDALALAVTEESAESIVVGVAEHCVRFDIGGPASAKCNCPAASVCQHILTASLWLKRTSTSVVDARSDTADSANTDPTPQRQSDDLHAALMRVSATDLVKHAGKAGYKWAWQFVQDLDAETGVTISNDRHVGISFAHPRITFRYMGGPLDSFIADVSLSKIEKYRVAAVMSYQRAHGAEIAAPETKRDNASLDFGKEHALPDAGDVSMRDSRARLRVSVIQLVTECVELGLSHLSQGIQERFSTLAVWAQGAEYHRLALQLRRVADHVEMLLERAGGADEHRLLDEITTTFGLVTALKVADGRGQVPTHLVGRARNTYEPVASLELLGLGAMPWRSGSGYVGLTMLFWSPKDKRFLSCTEARPESQRGFNPIARYKAAGSWGGLGAPAQATGRRILLTNAQLSALGRLSTAESTSATIQIVPDPREFAELLVPCSRWSDLQNARAIARRSLLAEPEPMREWFALRPSQFEKPRFDPTRQVAVWPLVDADDECIDAEIPYSDFAAAAIDRIERMSDSSPSDGTLVIARVRNISGRLIAEPLSLVRSDLQVTSNFVDALYFDSAAESGLVAEAVRKFRKLVAPHPKETSFTVQSSSVSAALSDLREWTLRRTERGNGAGAEDVVAQLNNLIGRLNLAGLSAFGKCVADAAIATELLRTNFLYLQYEHLNRGSSDDGP